MSAIYTTYCSTYKAAFFATDFEANSYSYDSANVCTVDAALDATLSSTQHPADMSTITCSYRTAIYSANETAYVTTKLVAKDIAD